MKKRLLTAALVLCLLLAAAGPLALAVLARAGIDPTQATVALRVERVGPELRRAAELALPHRLRRAPFEQAGDAGIDWEALFYG